MREELNMTDEEQKVTQEKETSDDIELLTDEDVEKKNDKSFGQEQIPTNSENITSEEDDNQEITTDIEDNSSDEIIKDTTLDVEENTLNKEIVFNEHTINAMPIPLEEPFVPPMDKTENLTTDVSTTATINPIQDINSMDINQSSPVTENTTPLDNTFQNAITSNETDVLSNPQSLYSNPQEYATGEEKEPQPKKKSKKMLWIAIPCLIIGVLLIVATICYLILNSNKKIISSSIDQVSQKLENAISINKDLEIGNTFTYSGNVNFHIESDLLKQLAQTSQEYNQYTTIIQNLNNTNNKIVYIQDASNNKLLTSLNSKINGSNLLNIKGYIENDTLYYFIDGLLDTYINYGEFDYFSNIKENDASMEDIKYLYQTSIKSLKNNLKDEYFTKEKVSTKINDVSKKVDKVTLKIDEKVLKELATNILEDLKKDKKSSDILKKYYKDLSVLKIDQNSQTLYAGEYISYSAYVEGILANVKKQELVFNISNNVFVLSYEENDVEKISLEVNHTKIGSIAIKNQKNTKNIQIMNSQNREVGSVIINKNGENSYDINARINYGDYAATCNINSDIKNVVASTSYEQDITVKMIIQQAGMVAIDTDMNIHSKVEKGATISEDVSNATSFLEIDNEKLLTLYTDLLAKMVQPQ